MANTPADNRDEGQPAEGVSRRDFLVMLGGATLGTFALPAVGQWADASQQPAVRKIVIAPTRQSMGGDDFMLVWTEETVSGVQSMMWHPQTANEKRDAQKFYEAARDFEPESLFRRAVDWFGELFAGKKRSPEEQALLRGILDAADDEAAVLRYADWLTAHKNPQGEFIRVDCAMEGMNGNNPQYANLSQRWTELYEQIGHSLVKPLARIGIKPLIAGQIMPSLFLEQGLVRTVDIEKPSVLPRRFKQLIDAAPLLRSINLDGEGMDVIGIAACPELAQIETLALHSCDLTDEGMAALTKSPFLTKLKHLSLGYNSLSYDAVQMLAESPLLGQLKSLELDGCDLGHDAIELLCKSPSIQGLEKLNLSNNHFNSKGRFELLSESPYFSSLKELNISSNKLTDESMEVLCSAPFFSKLEVLDLNSCDLEAATLMSMQAVRNARLKVWNLGSNKFGEAGFRALASLPLLATVENLVFDFCDVTDQGAITLIESPHLAPLKSFSLKYSEEVTDRTALAIAASPKMNQLEELLLGGTRLSAAGVAALAQSPGLQSLQTLELNDAPMGVEGALALSASPYFKGLISLVVSESEVTKQGTEALKKRFGNQVSCW